VAVGDRARQRGELLVERDLVVLVGRPLELQRVLDELVERERLHDAHRHPGEVLLHHDHGLDVVDLPAQRCQLARHLVVLELDHGGELLEVLR